MRPFWILPLTALSLLTSDIYADSAKPKTKPKAVTPKKVKKKVPKKAPMATKKTPPPPQPAPAKPAPPEKPETAPSAVVAAPEAEAPSCEVKPRRIHLLDIGPTLAYAWITPENNPTVTGPMGGIDALYQYRPLNNIYLGASFGWKMAPAVKNSMYRTIQDFNIQERIGYTAAWKDNSFLASFFSGVAVRYLPETVSSGSVSMDFSYAEFYAPVGVLFTQEYSPNFSVSLDAQWRPQLFPTVHIQPLGGTWWSLDYRIDNFFVALPIKYSACGDKYAGVISPYFEMWHDGASTATTVNASGSPTDLSLGLPSNTYLFTGITFSCHAEF